MKHLVFLLLLFPLSTLFVQTFEGTVYYTTEFEIGDKMAKYGLTKEIALQKMRMEGTWSDMVHTAYKGGDYISYTNFNPQSWSVYKSDTNKMYSFQKGDGADLCTVTDVSIDFEESRTGKKPTITKLDTLVNVGDVPCEVVRVKWKSGTYDYYYNAAMLKVDAKLYEGHVYDGWSEFLKISNSLPIRIVKTTNGLSTVTFTLSHFKAEPIDPALFLIPKLSADPELNLFTIANREIMRITK